ncbi:MAG TPA: 2'-5' RNA ligase family protein [Ktedonobacterales bacterium]|nr:2'-5' RNA ligase family protein [Ktedonobacterales bacterium]
MIATVSRAIVIFPELPAPALDAIQAVRRDYDPLAEVIPPHLTLVFPFASDLPSDGLASHMREAARGADPFDLVLAEVTGSEDEYLFLNVKRGRDELIALHDQLYSPPLDRHFDPRFTYTPHLTVGRVANRTTFDAALTDARVRLPSSFATTVRAISAYSIGADGARAVESTVAL